MFASMFNLFKKSVTNHKEDEIAESKIVEITTQDVEDMFTLLDVDESEIEDNSNNVSHCSTSKDVIEDVDLLSNADNHSEFSNDNDSVDHYDDTKSQVSHKGENKQALKQESKTTEDQATIKIDKQISKLQCPFTWNIKLIKNKNIILLMQNKYGEYNLNISSPEFTFERFIGNLIIAYELFHNDDSNTAQLKMLEIGKWLEELDSGTDEFYLSINIGLKHIMKATFIHMLFATNLIGEVKWLLDGIDLFSNMDSQSKATVYAVRAAILTEYSGSAKVIKKACDYALKACEIDPLTSHWFYIYSLALTAERRYLYTYKSLPSENEINAIQQAIMLSDGKNTFFNYHRMILDRDTTIRKYHENSNKYDKVAMEKNYQANKIIVQMIKTIISMEPKDPHIIVNCARTLMTLPVMVRDLNLGKQYLMKAFQMAPNDVSILKAIEKTINHYKEISNKNKHRTNDTNQNQTPSMNKTFITNNLSLLVMKHKNGEDPIPHLIALMDKYDGHEKWKIMAQICSYLILFKNNLRAGIEQFISLIEQPEMVTDHLITKHYSLFGSKKFNLAELICNEIRLATNSSNTSSEDMLFYYKMLTKIMETCNVKVKEVDLSMKDELIVDISVKSTNTTCQSETNLSDDNESLVGKNKNKYRKAKPKSYRRKDFQNKGSKMFNKKPEFNMRDRNIDSNFKQCSTENNTYMTNNTSFTDQMKQKMAKFTSTSNGGLSFSNNSDFSSVLENLKNLRTQSEIEHFTHQLYQHIGVSDGQKQNNSPTVSFDGFNEYDNQSHYFTNSSSQQSINPNSHLFSNSRSTRRPPNKYYTNKK